MPLILAGPGLMTNGFDVPKVTLYRSPVGIMGALWVFERGLAPPTFGAVFPRFSLGLFKG